MELSKVDLMIKSLEEDLELFNNEYELYGDDYTMISYDCKARRAHKIVDEIARVKKEIEDLKSSKGV